MQLFSSLTSGLHTFHIQNYKSFPKMAESNWDRNFNALIKSVMYFNFTKEFVLKCASDMKSNNKSVDSKSLLDECERYRDSMPSYDADLLESRASDVKESRKQSTLIDDTLTVPFYSQSHHYQFQLPLSSSSVHHSQKRSSLSSCSTNSNPCTSRSNSITDDNPISRLSDLDTCLPEPNFQNPALKYNDEDGVDGSEFPSAVSGMSNDGLDGWSVNSLPAIDFSTLSVMHNELSDIPNVASSITSQLNSVMLEKSVSTFLSSVSPTIKFDNSLVDHINKTGSSVNDQKSSRDLQNLVYDGAKNNILHEVCNYLIEPERNSFLNMHKTLHDLQEIECDGENIHQVCKYEIPEIEELGKQTHQSSSETTPSLVEIEKLVTICLELVEMEHELLEKSRLCSNCLENPRDVTFLPCGHFTTCRSCAEPIYVCPICNSSILATVNTYLS